MRLLRKWPLADRTCLGRNRRVPSGLRQRVPASGLRQRVPAGGFGQNVTAGGFGQSVTRRLVRGRNMPLRMWLDGMSRRNVRPRRAARKVRCL
jgi:hypothetical protein